MQTNTKTYYNHVDFITGGRWLQTRTATPIAKMKSTWMTEFNGELLLADSLKQINDAIDAVLGR